MWEGKRGRVGGTHVIGFSIALRAGELSDILSIRTGWVLMCSRTMSYMNAQGALVLMDPPAACDRETL